MKRLIFLVTIFCITLFLNAETICYTVSSRTSVEVSGDMVNGSQATYSQSGTGQKGQMTAGNYTSLVVSGLDGLLIQQISITMHSNKQAGSGSLIAKIGDNTIWSINSSEFASNNWYGSYTNEWVSISVNFDQQKIMANKDEKLQITIEATENSLFVQSYNITYSTATNEKRTIHFLTGTEDVIADITESAPGAGIIIPSYSYSDNVWHSIGWTGSIAEESNIKPNDLYKFGSHIYPQSDLTLYALFSNGDENNKFVQDTLLESGNYILNCAYYNLMPSGKVGEKKSGCISVRKIQGELERNDAGLYYYPIDFIDSTTLYYLEFYSDSTVLIYHYQTNTAVGYPLNDGSNLTQVERRWNYTVLPDKTVSFYHKYSESKTRYFAYESDYYRSTLMKYTRNANCLFLADNFPEKVEILYKTFATNNGLPSDTIEVIEIEDNNIINTENRIINIYDYNGRFIQQTNSNIDLSGFSKQIIIINVGNENYKVLCP